MIDHRDQQSQVRNQGDRGTCVAFAVSAAHEWVGAQIATRSPEDAMWAAHEVMPQAAQGEGTSVNYALIGLAKHDHAGEGAWPYGEPEWRSGRTVAALEARNRETLPRWRRLSDQRLRTIRAELEAQNAVVLTIGVVRRAWLSIGGLIDVGHGEKVAGNHAVLVIGASETEDADGELRIKNSWGEGWGEEGYGKIRERYLDAYGICAHAMER